MSGPSGVFARLAVGLVLLGGQGSCQSSPSPASTKPPVPREMLEVDSARQRPPFIQANNTNSRPAIPPDSQLIVLDDGEIQYRVSTWTICSNEDAKKCPDISSWPFRWDDSHEQVFQGKLDAPELNHLRTLLDRNDIRRLEGYDNAGPTVGNFKISINRANDQQALIVFGFQPAYDWAQNRPLIDLICEAKTIAQHVSKSDALPPWCNTHPPK